MVYIGVDPGAKGAFAFTAESETGKVVKVFPWDNGLFVRYMRGIANTHDHPVGHVIAAVEKVGAMPGQGVTSMFHFGESLGYIRGVLEGFCIPYQLVIPRRWKGDFGLIGKGKSASIEVCHRLYPQIDLRPTARCRKDSDGMADALLIMEYARRHL